MSDELFPEAAIAAWLDEHDIDWRREEMLGLCWDHYETTPLDRIRYDFAFTVPEDVDASGEIGIH